jgi:hypothetical protein
MNYQSITDLDLNSTKRALVISCFDPTTNAIVVKDVFGVALQLHSFILVLKLNQTDSAVNAFLEKQFAIWYPLQLPGFVYDSLEFVVFISHSVWVSIVEHYFQQVNHAQHQETGIDDYKG